MSELEIAPSNPAVSVPSSLDDVVRARRVSLQHQQTVELPVPSWGGLLVAKYHAISWKQLRAAATRYDKMSDQSVAETMGAADLLIEASDDVMFRSNESAAFESLGPWSLEVATRLGVTNVDSGRQALMVPDGIFQRDTQLMAHFGLLQEWQQGVDIEVNEELVGNSEAASQLN